MKLATAILAALLLTSTAFAQTRGAAAPRHKAPVAKAEAVHYGSVARNKLLNQAKRGKDVHVVEGAVMRRALLTGKRLNLPKPKPKHSWQRRR